MTLDEKYRQEWKRAKKLIMKRRRKKAIISLALALLGAIIGTICWKLKLESMWCQTGMIIGPCMTIVFLLLSVEVLFRRTSSENEMLRQINQAYENAKMMGK